MTDSIFGRLKIVIMVALFTAAGVAIVLILHRPPRVVTFTLAARPPTVTPAPIVVYVTGAIQSPQKMITLPPGSRVIDAINASGGVAPNADLTTLNQAFILRDGDQVFVPAQVSVPVVNEAIDGDIPADTALVDRAEPAGSAMTSVLLNINTASAAELETLPGCGPVMAAAIIAYRNAHGGFSGLADLDNVKGVGAATLESWKDLIRFF